MMMDSVSDERVVHIFGRDIPRDLFIVRLFYLLYFASFGSLFPLLAIYFKQLGMTAAQAGILLGSRPIVEFIASPFWGLFGDRFRKGKRLRDLWEKIGKKNAGDVKWKKKILDDKEKCDLFIRSWDFKHRKY